MPDSPQGEFIEKATAAAGDKPLDPNKPRVPFESSLKLTGDQEKDMIDYAFKRLADIGNELGRDQTLQPTWWANLAPSPNMQSAAQGFLQASTFLGKRSRFDATFMNDVSWRPWTMGVDNIFMQSNIVVPLARRICRQMIARAKKSFFGSDPWFSADPTPGTGDEMEDAQAEAIERYCRFKAKEGGSKENMGRGIAQALILGECAMKTTYVVRDQLFDTEAEVLHTPEGVPVKDQKGNYIPSDAKWKDAEDGNGTQVLDSDGITMKPDAPIYQKLDLNRRQVLFEGAKTEPIYYKDFLCPLTAANVQEADCIAHIYDKQVFEFVDLIVKRGMVDNTPAGREDATKRMLSLVKALDSNTSAPKAAVDMAIRPNENFTPVPSTAGDTSGPVAEFVEFYLWRDVNGDGIAENVCLICDRSSRMPVFYDHVANVTTDGLRPIEIMRINGIEGRWYGLGIIELFESYQTIVDLMVNRWNFSQSRSGRVDLWSPKNTLEGERDGNLKMNWGGTYTKKPGMKKEDIIETVYLTDTKFEALHEMIQFFMQLAMNESGVTNANDNQAAGMQSAKLATGIMQIEQSGDELFMPIIEDLTSACAAIINREVDVNLANIDPEEVNEYLEGEDAGLGEISPDDVRTLKLRCTIELTTHKNQQILQLSAQAVALVRDFYTSNPPQIQELVAPLYRQQLRILAPNLDPDKIIVPQPILPGAPAGAPPAPGAAPAPGGQDVTAPAGGMPAQMSQVSRPKGT